MGVTFDQELGRSHRRAVGSVAADAAGHPAAFDRGRVERTVTNAISRADEAVRLLAEAALLVAPGGPESPVDTHVAALLQRLDSLSAGLRTVETQSGGPAAGRLVWTAGPNAQVLHAVDPRIGASACGLVGFPVLDAGVWPSGPRCPDCAFSTR
jgi:hypothetical protein